MILAAYGGATSLLASTFRWKKLFKNYSFKFRMLRRYREIKEDMPLSAAKIEDDTLSATILQQVLMSFISFYLPLSPSIYKASGACERCEVASSKRRV